MRTDHEADVVAVAGRLRRSRVLGGEAEQLSLAHDRSCRRGRSRIRSDEIERHVKSTAVVVVQPEVEQQTQVPFSDHYHEVKELSAGTPDRSLAT